MSEDPSSSGDPLGQIADEFAEALRRGERPSVEEYARRYPRHAKDIRELLPALLLMEQAKSSDEPRAGSSSGGGAPAGRPLQQLGDYRILREVGRGGIGVVYEAEQVSLGRHVALKVLPEHVTTNERQRTRFEREARSAARLHHTNIVPVFGVGEQDGMHYYVMQFIQGLGLDEVLEEVRRLAGGEPPAQPFSGRPLHVARRGGASAADVALSLVTGQPVSAVTAPEGTRDFDSSMAATPMPGRLSDTFSLSGSGLFPAEAGKRHTYWNSVARIGLQVAGALNHAHEQGVLHRDIKPANLLLDTQGAVWVTDFGLAKASDQQDLTNPGDVVGTLRYLPPEAFEGTADRRGDLYALGLTLYEMLALSPAFAEKDRNRLIKQVTTQDPPSLTRINRAIPRDLVTIVHKAIDRDPARRYQTGAELASDLQRFLAEEPIVARRYGLAERFRRWCRRNPAIAGLTAAVGVLLLAITVGSLYAAYSFSRFARSEAEAKEEAEEKAGQIRRLADAEAKARKQTQAKADEIRVGLERLNRANGFMEGGRVAADRNRWTAALRDYTRAVEQRPDLATFRFARAQFYFRIGLLDEAAADFQEAFWRQRPTDPDLCHAHASLRAYVGDQAGYRSVCAAMLARFGDTDDPETARVLVLSCTLVPGAVTDLPRLVKVAERVLAAHPYLPSSHKVLGMAYYRAGQYDQAVTHLTRVSPDTLNPNTVYFPSGRPVLAMAQFGQKQAEPARASLQVVNNHFQNLIRAMSTGPAGPDLPDALAVYVGRLSNARPVLRSALDPYTTNEVGVTEALTTGLLGGFLLDREARRLLGQPPSAGVAFRHAWVARGYAKLDRWQEAVAHIRKAKACTPSFAPVLIDSGRLHAHAGDPDRSAEDFAAAIKAEPGNVLTWLARGEVHALKGRIDDAAADVDRAVELLRRQSRGMLRPRATLEKLYLREDVFDKLVQRRPRDVQLWLERGALHRDRLEWGKAIEVYTRADRLHPKNREIQTAVGECYLGWQKFPEAIAAFDRAIALRPGSWQLYWLRMLPSLHLKKWEQAARDAARGLKLFPGNDTGRRQLYEALLPVGDLFAVLLKLEPKNERHWLERGWWHFRNERPDQGFADLTKVITMRPERRDHLLQRADLYAQFGSGRRRRGTSTRCSPTASRTTHGGGTSGPTCCSSTPMSRATGNTAGRCEKSSAPARTWTTSPSSPTPGRWPRRRPRRTTSLSSWPSAG
jgi:serine/threonine protein kinase/predicted Zn-dependent protease